MTKHSESADSNYRLLAIAAARLRSEGKTQMQIGQILGKSQPEISRLLAFAQEQKFLASWPTLLRQNISSSDLEEVEHRFFVHDELRKMLRHFVPRKLHFDVYAVYDGESEFGIAASSRVTQLLLRANRIGIMWGRTITRLVDGIKARRDVFEGLRNHADHCIPLCGDPVYLMNQRLLGYSASQLASELGKAINVDRPMDQPCLVGVPAYISRKVLRQMSDSNWADFVRDIPGYRAIFGANEKTDGGLVAGVDTLITGAGIIVMGKERPQQETAAFISERLAQEAITKKDLNDLVCGDIGGLLLERKGLKESDRRTVKELNQGWTGVKESHFKTVAAQASPEGAPGVVLVAEGAAKAEMVVDILKRGYVNELVIDSGLATALKKLAD